MYILDRDRQITLIKEMTQLRKDSENWVVYYHHPTTNEMWKSYFPRSRGDRRGPKVMRPEPVPEPESELVDRCLRSDVEDDAMGAGLELSVKPSCWENVTAVLEENYLRYRPSQLKRFIRFLGIMNFEELFAEIGYDPASDGLGEEHFASLRSRIWKVKLKRFLWPF